LSSNSHIFLIIFILPDVIIRRSNVRSQIRRIRRPSADEELDVESALAKEKEANELDDVVQKITLEKMSLEDRRKEAKKPLYLVRYE
jgi:hypothetical protein